MCRPHSAQGMPGCQCVPDEVEKAALGETRNHVEGHEGVSGANHVLVVGIEDAEVVLITVASGIRHFPEAEGFKPLVNLTLTDRDNVEAWLGGDDAQVPGLRDHPFEAVESRDEEVVKIEPFEILERCGLPKMETAGIFGG